MTYLFLATDAMAIYIIHLMVKASRDIKVPHQQDPVEYELRNGDHH